MNASLWHIFPLKVYPSISLGISCDVEQSIRELFSMTFLRSYGDHEFFSMKKALACNLLVTGIETLTNYLSLKYWEEF